MSQNADTAASPESPQVAYVLISSEKDTYAEITAVSAALVRKLYPKAGVWLFTDAATRRSLEERRSALLELVSRVEVVEPQGPSQAGRAWNMKTLARDRIDGDFLFLDGDAMPVRPFHEVFKGDFDFAGVLDRHDAPRDYKIPPKEMEMCGKLGWALPRLYFNAGVLVFKETPAARALAREWNARHLKTFEAGMTTDQMALATAVDTSDLRVKVLPARYNAQIAMKRSVARGAAIFHFFTYGQARQTDNMMGLLVNHMKATGKIDQAALHRFLQTGYPWADDQWISGQWAMGHYATALKLCGLKALGFKKKPLQTQRANA